MRPYWESFPIKKHFFAACVLSLILSGTAQAIVIGPSQTKKERERSKRGAPAHKEPMGPHEAVMQSFLSGDFAESERLAGRFRAEPPDGRSDDVRMIQALSLMKLGRFEEARPILESLQSGASSPELRAQAAYSLGDSYYFKNDRAQADVFYERALERYPDHGEAGQVKRFLGMNGQRTPSQPLGLGRGTVSQQLNVEQSVLYSVQVGSFSKRRNAERLLNKLMRNRLDAYITQDEASRYFRVRVGRLTAREDAQSLETRLKKSGYPTKIFP